MKRSRISTWLCSLGISLLAAAALPAGASYALSIGARAGIHDFSRDATRDFYLYSAGGMLSCSFYESRQFGIETAAGLFHRSVQYNGGLHTLYIVPLTVSFIVSFPMEDMKTVPYFGTGVGGWYKREESPTAQRTFNYITYGYHLIGGLKYPLSDKLSLQADLRYCLIMTDFKEEMNLSGVQTTAGVAYRLD